MESTHHSQPSHSANEALLSTEIPPLGALSQEHHRRLFQRGLLWLGVGVLLMGLSFGINLLLFHSDTSFTTIMYVLTSVGTLCIVKGLADIMGF